MLASSCSPLTRGAIAAVRQEIHLPSCPNFPNHFCGFGIIATPLQYGVTGIQTFLVSQSGVVYQRNLGPGSTAIAAGIKAYDPGPGWQKVEE